MKIHPNRPIKIQSPITEKQPGEEEPKIPQILKNRIKVNQEQMVHDGKVLIHDGKVKVGRPEEVKVGRHEEVKVGRPQEVIIDVNEIQNNGRISNIHTGGIRGDIDKCLEAVFEVYEETRVKHKESKHIQLKHPNLKEIQIKDNAIHRIDHALVMEYIATIYKEYGFKNRFQQQKENHTARPTSKPLQSFEEKEQNHREKGIENSSKKHKKYINLTLSGKSVDSVGIENQNNSPQYKKDKFLENEQSKPVKNNTRYSFRTSSPYDILSHGAPQNEVQIFKVVEQFRYCICCEQPILSANINYHELYECKELIQIYNFDIIQLKTYIIKKIQKIKLKIQQYLQKIALVGKSDGYHENIIQEIKFIVEETQRLEEKHLENVQFHYDKFKEAMRNQYFYVIEQTNKLEWFKTIYCRLSEMENTHGREQLQLGSDLAKRSIGMQTFEHTFEESDKKRINERFSHVNLSNQLFRFSYESTERAHKENVVSSFNAETNR